MQSKNCKNFFFAPRKQKENCVRIYTDNKAIFINRNVKPIEPIEKKQIMMIDVMTKL